MKDIIKEELKRQGLSLRQFAKQNNLDYQVLLLVLNFYKVSRPLIVRLAEILQKPELVYYYEKELQKRGKGRYNTQTKGGGL
jgi:transcriptional regulator with XRE-family HTH domain